MPSPFAAARFGRFGVVAGGVVALAAALAVLAASALASTLPGLGASASPTTARVEAVPHLGHVFVIIGHNTDTPIYDYQRALPGDRAAPGVGLDG
ncbi:MAG TPA: hypothetical protein VG365_02365 [Solirubrobacteraceae bacterium]|nr:hypothetical protein [Solirubrobacteraceae bacterium]